MGLALVYMATLQQETEQGLRGLEACVRMAGRLSRFKKMWSMLLSNRGDLRLGRHRRSKAPSGNERRRLGSWKKGESRSWKLIECSTMQTHNRTVE